MSENIGGIEIHEAAAVGDADTLENCLRSGRFDVNRKDVEWGYRTALHWACMKGYIECIKLLLEYGAKGTSRMNGGWTPAHCAAEVGRTSVLKTLHNNKVSISKKDFYGDTPRNIASMYGHEECVRYIDSVDKEIRKKRALGTSQEESDDNDTDEEQLYNMG